MSSGSVSIKPPVAPRNWDQRMLHEARNIAGWSKDPSTKVGALAVRDRRIVATGYNGLPSGVRDDEARLRDRSLKLAMSVHAETNLVAYASRYGACLAGCTVYIWPLPPCSHCSAVLIQADIARVVVPDYPEPLRWMESFQLGRVMFFEAGVTFEKIPMTGPVGHEMHEREDFKPDVSDQAEILKLLDQPLIPE